MGLYDLQQMSPHDKPSWLSETLEHMFANLFGRFESGPSFAWSGHSSAEMTNDHYNWPTQKWSDQPSAEMIDNNFDDQWGNLLETLGIPHKLLLKNLVKSESRKVKVVKWKWEKHPLQAPPEEPGKVWK